MDNQDQETIQQGVYTRAERERFEYIEAREIDELKAELRPIIALQAEIDRRLKEVTKYWSGGTVIVDDEMYRLETDPKTGILTLTLDPL